jgi:hypothetical protein
MYSPEDFFVNDPVQGTMTLRYPQEWIAAVGTCGETVILANSTSAILRPMTGMNLESGQVSGRISFVLPDQLPRIGLSRNAKPIDVLKRIFDNTKQWVSIRESKPSPEHFTVNGRQGVAATYHCRNCIGDQSYMLVVQAKNGYVFADFDFRGMSIEELRDTLRAVVVSVEFAKSNAAANDSSAAEVDQSATGESAMGKCTL